MTEDKNIFRIKSEPIGAHYQFSNYITSDIDSFVIEQIKKITLTSRFGLNRQICIIGSTGVGKTHLSKAFCNYIVAEKPDSNPHYTTSRNFRENFINSVMTNENAAFIKELTNYSSLVLDDINTLAGKEKALDRLLQVLDDFLSKNKPVVITSSEPLNKLWGFNEKLISRILGGVTVILDQLDYYTLLKYLNQKVQDMEINISSDLLSIIASLPYSSDIRLLNGILESIKFIQNKTHKRIDYYQLQNVLNFYTPLQEKIAEANHP